MTVWLRAAQYHRLCRKRKSILFNYLYTTCRFCGVRARGARAAGGTVLEDPLGVEAQLIERAIAGAVGATDCVRAVGIGTADRGAAVIHLLVLVDQGEVERLDRLVGEADVEVLVLQVRGHVFAQLGLVVAPEHRPLRIEGIRGPARKPVRLVADRHGARGRDDRRGSEGGGGCVLDGLVVLGTEVFGADTKARVIHAGHEVKAGGGVAGKVLVAGVDLSKVAGVEARTQRQPVRGLHADASLEVDILRAGRILVSGAVDYRGGVRDQVAIPKRPARVEAPVGPWLSFQCSDSRKDSRQTDPRAYRRSRCVPRRPGRTCLPGTAF